MLTEGGAVELIKQAGKSWMGVVSLLIIAISVIAYLFFQAHRYSKHNL